MIVLTLALVLMPWLLGGKSFRWINRSPDGAYAVVFYTPPRWQRLLHLTMENPAMVELIRTDNSIALHSSHVFDLIDSPVLWALQAGRVSIGQDVHFRDLPRLPPRND